MSARIGTAYAIRKKAPVAGLVSERLYNSGANDMAPAPASAISITPRSASADIGPLLRIAIGEHLL